MIHRITIEEVILNMSMWDLGRRRLGLIPGSDMCVDDVDSPITSDEECTFECFLV